MSDFKGQLGQYKIIRTKDNSPTLWSEFFDENCHSDHGAYSETIYNYIEGCKILTRPISSILEIGYGLGIGLKATLEQYNPDQNHPLHFVSVELDQELVEWSKKNVQCENFDFSRLELRDQVYQFENESLKVDIIIGDATTTLKQTPLPSFNAIYQDAFSPKKNPALWSVEWFEMLKDLAAQDCILSTYSASVSIRKSLLEAGWHPHSHKGFAGKRERTSAHLVGPADESLERRLRASAAQALRRN
ncbi:MAG: hypothetical protein CME71_01475 [Halobacteriovorax sp.]|nr:hypothetical protein [Halobacteriovorax sp.]